MRYTVATLALTTALLTGGCGQMGPLYEPEATVPARPTASTSTTTPTSP